MEKLSNIIKDKRLKRATSTSTNFELPLELESYNKFKKEIEKKIKERLEVLKIEKK